MTCHHGTSDVIPLAVPFKDDEELRIYLGLPAGKIGETIVEHLTADQRKEFAAMRAVENELKAGRAPRGVIACDRKPRRRP